jgi:hypothetical protein
MIESFAVLRVARSLQVALGLASTVPQPIGGGTLLFVQPVGPLARLTKLDDVTHTQLDDHPASEDTIIVSSISEPEMRQQRGSIRTFPYLICIVNMPSMFGAGFDNGSRANPNKQSRFVMRVPQVECRNNFFYEIFAKLQFALS